ncbi:MAG: hypothetical protein D4S01_06495 [Dehalococcoidia bacterium]|nr:MAG: hypothetical protein D4S01_06495 [Dehalococcoidia bacterium]
MKIKLITLASLALVCFLGGGCAHSLDFDNRLSSIVEPYSFSIVEWESRAISREANQWLFGKDEKIDDEIHVVMEYFSSGERIKTLESELEAINAGEGQGNPTSIEAELNILQERRIALKEMVERIIEKQVKETLVQEGIFHPIDEYIRLKVSFPPINFKLEKPPHLLVISPREKIESMREITLQTNISLEEIEGIESEADKLGVSSLVVELGGLGATYPSLVTTDADLEFTIDTATEEWLHQYLVFKPLGFLYLLDLIGVSRNYEIATINETLASMVSDEIGSIVCQKYYSQYENNGARQNQEAEAGFDFNREMREIRRAVDNYLAQGEIEQAEEFMEQKRQYLASRGYYIRKLNQAYFAFHGTYADDPTSISPIGLELKELRSRSASLKDFLNTVAAMTSRQDLIDSIK